MITRVFRSFVFTILWSSLWIHAASSSSTITGLQITQQASEFFAELGYQIELKVSKKRHFYPCDSSLEFSPRSLKNWSSVKVACPSANWSVLLQSTALSPEAIRKKPIEASTDTAVIMNRNITKGEVIRATDVVLTDIPASNKRGTFTNMKAVIGRKTTKNLARGTTLKSRHLAIDYDVSVDDEILLFSGTESFKVSTYVLALEAGQIGDMVLVQNLKSGKVFKAVVTDEKKVAVITNN
jgi:flagella basal body P-ring formation protein FlgA